jgi:HPt (histidine-containing phosphotransfer) domain-containing protein
MNTLIANDDDGLSGLMLSSAPTRIERSAAGCDSADPVTGTAVYRIPNTDYLSTGKSPALPVFSREELLEELDGDEDLLRRMVAIFHENTPWLMEQIRGFIARKDSANLARYAHTLLGSLGPFGAKAARELTQLLEAHAHHEDYEHIDPTFTALEREITEVYAALSNYVAA